MTITVDDVKLLKSQRLTDEDGAAAVPPPGRGGSRRSTNLFPDILRLDRTIGRINLRKAFAGISSNSAEPYLGAHAIVTRAPADPRVSVLLFNTGSQTGRAPRRAQRHRVLRGAGRVCLVRTAGQPVAGPARHRFACSAKNSGCPRSARSISWCSSRARSSVRITDVESRLEQFAHDYGNGNFVNFTRRRLDLSISAHAGRDFFPAAR
ncbi:hypothetical protein P4050_00465 [Pseudomonas aeruginosa]|nr:hypothetical protein [Pseudomonas aeruginosa]